MGEKKVKPGDVVIKQGDEADCLYVIDSGVLSCYKLFPGNKDPTLLKRY